jgi:hypothetical protein
LGKARFKKVLEYPNNPLLRNIWAQCYKTLIYPHSTVTQSFCVLKQYYDGNYCGMGVSNTSVIYGEISTLEITGIFIALRVNYCGI